MLASYSRSIMVRSLKLQLQIFIIISLALASFYIYYSNYTYSPNTSIVIYIPPTTSSSKIAQMLYKNQAISSPSIFLVLTKLHALNNRYLKFGEYEIKPHSRPSDIARLLSSGAVIQHKITIPEGLSNFQILQLLNASYGITGEVTTVPYKEGWLMPDTYQYTYPTEKITILATMNKAMKDFVSTIAVNQESTLKTIDEVIILASIVEKETAIIQEQPQVASVYLNRLRLGMPLQADPTVLYSLTNGSYNLGRQLLYKDLATPSPYNTYLNRGLPPTAIANPGKKAISATISPISSKALYFVADGSGGHIFSHDYPTHLKNVQAYRKTTALKKSGN